MGGWLGRRGGGQRPTKLPNPLERNLNTKNIKKAPKITNFDILRATSPPWNTLDQETFFSREADNVCSTKEKFGKPLHTHLTSVLI